MELLVLGVVIVAAIATVDIKGKKKDKDVTEIEIKG